MKSGILPTLFALALTAAPAAAFAAIASSPEAATPLAVGSKAPSAIVVNEAGDPVDLAAALGGKPTLLIFYRGGWCPYCNKHLATLSETEEQMLGMGYQILGVSPDTVESLKETSGKHHLAYKLFSDRSMNASAAYGLAFYVDAATKEKYKGYGIDLAPVPGESDARWLPVPAAYIVAADGTIKFAYTNADYKTRVTTDELIKEARAALE